MTREQLARYIVARGRQRGATQKEILSAIETGLVEANLTNPSGGDADSGGWRQERRSIYKDPTNVAHSVDRYYNETRKVRDKYGTAGALAAAVQRPAAQYRGRYQERRGDALAVLRAIGANDPKLALSVHSVTHTTTDTAGLEQANKKAVLARYLQKVDPGSALLTTGAVSPDAVDPSQYQHQETQTVSAGGRGPHTGGKFDVLELFWQGQNGINLKNGQRVPQGYVAGHTDHVHVASGPRQTIELGKLAQSMGLHVGQNPHFGGVDPVHAPHSYHYRNGQAIDVSGDPQKMAEFAHLVARMRKR